MSDINDNIKNQIIYGINTPRIRKTKDSSLKVPAETAEQLYVQDTGVLGRSQVCEFKGSDIEKTVLEAVKLAKEQPVRLGCSEKMFDALQNYYINRGLSEKASYYNALLGEEEFLDISAPRRH